MLFSLPKKYRTPETNVTLSDHPVPPYSNMVQLWLAVLARIEKANVNVKEFD
jgi:hypothetical protein